MTTCSSVAALAMMPLLLFIFCREIDNLEAAVPYGGIVTILVLTLVPCAIGILVNHHKPNYATLVKKVRLSRQSHPRYCKVSFKAPADALPPLPPQVGLGILVVSSVIVSILSGMAVKDVLWMIFMPDVLTVATLMPLIGFTLGYVMSYICRLSPQ